MPPRNSANLRQITALRLQDINRGGTDADGYYPLFCYAGRCPITVGRPRVGGSRSLAIGIHVNRVERDLRSAGLSELKRGRLTILDWKGLQEAGDFDLTYLHLTPSQKLLLDS